MRMCELPHSTAARLTGRGAGTASPTQSRAPSHHMLSDWLVSPQPGLLLVTAGDAAVCSTDSCHVTVLPPSSADSLTQA